MYVPQSVYDILHLVDHATLEEIDMLENRLIERKFALGIGRFNRGKIYKILLDDVIVYVGSTVRSLESRWAGHKSHFRSCPNTSWSQFVTSNGGPDRFVISLIEEVPCRNLKELLKREGELIAKLNPLCNVMMNSLSPPKNSIFDLKIQKLKIPSFVDIPCIESNLAFRESVVASSKRRSYGQAKAVLTLFKYAYLKWIVTEPISENDQVFIFDQIVRSKSSLQVLMNIIRCCGKTVGSLGAHVSSFCENQTGISLPLSPVARVETRRFCSQLGVSSLGQLAVSFSRSCKSGMMSFFEKPCSVLTESDVDEILLDLIKKFVSPFGLEAEYNMDCQLCLSYANEFSKTVFESGLAKIHAGNNSRYYAELPPISEEVFEEFWKQKTLGRDTAISNPAMEKYLFDNYIVGNSDIITEKDRAFLFDNCQNDQHHHDLLIRVCSICKNASFDICMKNQTICHFLDPYGVNAPISLYFEQICPLLGLATAHDVVTIVDHTRIKNNLEFLARVLDRCMILLHKPQLNIKDADIRNGKCFKKILYKLQVLFRQCLGLDFVNIKGRKGKNKDGLYQLKFVDSFFEVLYTSGVV